MRALWKLQATDPGFRAEGVLTLRTALPMPKYETTARRAEFYTRVLSGARGLPGVSGAAYISFLPMIMRGGIWPVASTASRRTLRIAHRQHAFRDARILRGLGIPLRAGRDVERSRHASIGMSWQW